MLGYIARGRRMPSNISWPKHRSELWSCLRIKLASYVTSDLCNGRGMQVRTTACLCVFDCERHLISAEMRNKK